MYFYFFPASFLIMTAAYYSRVAQTSTEMEWSAYP
jgi:hypothetical protein